MKRDSSFDFIKGILILLVVFGHAIYLVFKESSWTEPIFHIIYSFHMPLFIFLAGYFFSSSLKLGIRELVRKKFSRLLVPTIIFTLFQITMNLDSVDYNRSTLNFNQVCKTYLFTISLFTLTILYYIFFKGNRYVKIGMIIIYLCLVSVYNHIHNFLLIDCQVIRMTLIMGLGILYREYHLLIHQILQRSHMNKLYTIAWILIILGIILVRWVFGINLLKYHPIIRIVDGVICSIFVFAILKYLYPYIETYMHRLSQCFVKLGKISMGLYLIHIVFYKWFLLYSINVSIGSNLWSIIYVFLVMMLLSIVIHRLINKLHLSKYLLGE